MSGSISNAQENVEALAILISSYYRDLIRNGVPDELANLLTLSFQEITIRMSLIKSNKIPD